MKKKIFVGNLSWKATEDSLRPIFETCGNVVSIKIITDHTGRSKGFGFVEMETAEEAQAVLDKLNGKSVLDREMRISLAQERTDRPRTGDRPERSGERREHRSYGNNSRGGYRRNEEPSY